MNGIRCDNYPEHLYNRHAKTLLKASLVNERALERRIQRAELAEARAEDLHRQLLEAQEAITHDHAMLAQALVLLQQAAGALEQQQDGRAAAVTSATKPASSGDEAVQLQAQLEVMRHELVAEERVNTKLTSCVLQQQKQTIELLPHLARARAQWCAEQV